MANDSYYERINLLRRTCNYGHRLYRHVSSLYFKMRILFVAAKICILPYESR
uniref:Uncharacterized protein n=1 Tax=Aegilops tauschii subsp. strangulata TaxID=200361 RepID=A0A453QEA7_AEGTS